MAQKGTRVLLRVRPLSTRELQERGGGAARCLEVPADGANSAIYVGSDGPANPCFGFDSVLRETATQSHVFEEVADVVRAVLDGFNGTVLAFGQTGSGKTHTLVGCINDPAERGIVPRAVAELARGIEAYAEPCQFRVTLSVVEIYCEKIKDLLRPEKDNLQVMQDPSRGIFVADATELPVRSEAECVQLMQEGIANRAVSATAMNAGSSRSHCVVTLVVEKTYADGGVAASKLCLVDLAGSERQDKTGASGQTLTEGSLINKSLSTLANVVNALSDSRAKAHVPYRDSKLTRVLQDSLGGSAHTALIVCASPSLFNDAETLSSLRFGQRARGMQNTVAASVVRRSPEQLARMLAAAQAEATALRHQLEQVVGSGMAVASSGNTCCASDGDAARGSVGPSAADRFASALRLPSAQLLVAVLQALGLLAYWLADEYMLVC